MILDRMRAARAALLMLSCAALSCGRATVEETETTAAVPVHVVKATRKTIVGVVSATAIVTPGPGAEFTVTAPDSARIAELPRAEGDRVRRGDLLVRFDIPSLGAAAAQHRAEVAQARAKVEQARAAAERVRGLLDRGVAARRDVEDATRDLAEAEAALAQASAAASAADALAERATVRAPFAGIVARRLHNPGDLVEPSASDPILRLIDPVHLQLVAAVPLADLARIARGHVARVFVTGSGETERAVVASLPAAVDAASATAEVRLTFAAPTQLTAGSPVQLEILAEERADVLSVPADALIRDGGTTKVVVVGADGKAHRRDIVPGLDGGGDVEVRSGLAVGDQIIIRGQEALPDGATVTVVQ